MKIAKSIAVRSISSEREDCLAVRYRGGGEESKLGLKHFGAPALEYRQRLRI
jgi:hypothetical protein